MEELIDVVRLIGGMFLVCVAIMLPIMLPVAWCDGHAKSAYLKQTQGIDVPWYQATWLEVNTTNANVTVRAAK